MSLIFVFLVGFLEIIGQTCSFSNTSLTAGPGAIVITNHNLSAPAGSIPNSDYAYEAWTDAFPPDGVIPEGKVPADFKLTLYTVDTEGNATAAFRAEWKKSSDFLARAGLKLDNKKYYEYKNIIAEFAYDRKPYTCVPVPGEANKCVDDGAAGDYSYIGVYGWTRNPLVEYYVVDDWFGNPYDQINGDSINVGEGTVCYDYISQGKTCYVGTFTVDGSAYKVYNHRRTNAFTIDGTGDFDQYYSLRQDPRKCGTISITEHFKAWESLGLPLGTMYEAQLLVEAGGGIGWIDYTHAAVKANIPDKCDPDSDDHYQLPSGGGPCTERACADRRKNSLDPLQPCGSGDCYWDQGNANRTKCIVLATACSNSDHYDGTKDSTNRVCKPKVCTSRIMNSIVKLEPCGPGDCYWDQGATVATKCIDDNTNCTNSDLYEKKEDSHSCELKACADRTKNDVSALAPCGPGDCYWDTQATDPTKCIEKGTLCTNSDLYEQKEDTHACGLKPPKDPEPAGSSIAVVNVALLLLAVFWLTFG